LQPQKLADEEIRKTKFNIYTYNHGSGQFNNDRPALSRYAKS
jgi:hypothetical protein